MKLDSHFTTGDPVGRREMESRGIRVEVGMRGPGGIDTDRLAFFDWLGNYTRL